MATKTNNLVTEAQTELNEARQKAAKTFIKNRLLRIERLKREIASIEKEISHQQQAIERVQDGEDFVDTCGALNCLCNLSVEIETKVRVSEEECDKECKASCTCGDPECRY